eukprot:COSAG06_NODE_59387_length_280_cov_0.731429_1_plen_76_part_01
MAHPGAVSPSHRISTAAATPTTALGVQSSASTLAFWSCFETRRVASHGRLVLGLVGDLTCTHTHVACLHLNLLLAC